MGGSLRVRVIVETSKEEKKKDVFLYLRGVLHCCG